jgi:thioredoxin-like negative regulator of GroEL
MKSTRDISVALNEANFQEEVLAQKQPVLVLVTSSLTGSSKIMQERFDELAGSCGESVKLGILDGDQDKKLAKHYHIQVFPTTLIFKDGVLADRLPFLVSVDELMARVKPLV